MKPSNTQTCPRLVQFAVAEKALQMRSQEGRRFKCGGQMAKICARFEKSQSVEY